MLVRYDRRWVKTRYRVQLDPYRFHCEIDSCAQTELDGFRPVRQLLFDEQQPSGSDIIRSACGGVARRVLPARRARAVVEAAAAAAAAGAPGPGARGARGEGDTRGAPSLSGEGDADSTVPKPAPAPAPAAAEEAFEGVGCATRGRRGARALDAAAAEEAARAEAARLAAEAEATRARELLAEKMRRARRAERFARRTRRGASLHFRRLEAAGQQHQEEHRVDEEAGKGDLRRYFGQSRERRRVDERGPHATKRRLFSGDDQTEFFG